ncbi:SIL1 family protein [Megaselia abdita]
MMFLRNSSLLFLIILVPSILAKEQNDSFIPTDEWQEIKEGQQVPMGLHYRINLQTGKKEARNLQDEQETPSLSPEDEEKLKRVAHSPDAPSPKKRFESLGSLKDKLTDLKGEFKSDAELITKLFQEYKNATESKEPKEFIRLLDDFSYLVHQIDNALWFIEAGGLEQVILPMLVNQTDPLIRTNALRVLGTLTQNNPKAKVEVFQRNFANFIAKVIINFETNQELSSGLFAFGSLMRRFPAAQKEILERYGIKALTSVLEKEKVELKNVAKAVTILTDLYQEAQETTLINLDTVLVENKLCESVENVFIKRRQEFNGDIVEYFLPALKTFESLCGNLWFENADLRHALLTLSNDLLRTQQEFSREVAERIFEIVQDFYNINRDEL